MLFFPHLKRQKLLSFGLLFVTLAIGIVIGTILNTGVKANRQAQGHVAGGSNAPDASPLVVPEAVPIANDFTKLTKRVEPSVVYIESDYLAKPAKRGRHGENDAAPDETTDGDDPHSNDPSDTLKRFNGKENRSYRTEGSGTGFIVDKNGYIITNHHVVEKADRIKVRLAGEEIDYRGRVVGFDKETDLAVLKIEAKQPLVPVQIGNSESVQVGDWVIAIGSPFGLQATVTAGIVSAERTSRDLPGAGQFQNFLQTDAAINPGNSGGPLLNTRGEVIGVNTMIATHSGSYEGIGFALPSNMAVKVYNDIIKSGRVVRGSIGIRWTRNNNDGDTLRAFGLDHGVLVESVAPDGPANRAGIKPDDIVLSLNDKPVRDGQELVNKVAEMPIRSAGVFNVDRNGKRMDFKVVVEDRSQVWQSDPQVSEVRVAPASSAPAGVAPVRFGITIMRLTQRERKDMAIEAKDGVKVVSIDPGSFADDIGMAEGDAILSINRQPVGSPDDVMRLQSALKPGQAVAMHVVRGSIMASSGGSRHGSPQRYYLSGRLPEP